MRFSRTLAVTPGHSKTDAEQDRCPLSRCDQIAQAAVRFPPAPRKVPSPGVLYRLNGRIAPPSDTLGDQGEPNPIVILTRPFTVETSAKHSTAGTGGRKSDG